MFRARAPRAAPESELSLHALAGLLGLFRRGLSAIMALPELRYTLPALAVRDALGMRAHRLTLPVYVMLRGTSTCSWRLALLIGCLHPLRTVSQKVVLLVQLSPSYVKPRLCSNALT